MLLTAPQRGFSMLKRIEETSLGMLGMHSFFISTICIWFSGVFVVTE